MIRQAALPLVLALALVVAACGPASAQPAPNPTNPPPAPAPDIWVPRSEAVLSVLEKVRAQAGSLTVRTGQSATFGSLTIAVRSCVVRPPDQIADAAAAVEITDSRAGAPGFRGWLLANEPSVSMLESPIYDVRLIACR